MAEFMQSGKFSFIGVVRWSERAPKITSWKRERQLCKKKRGPGERTSLCSRAIGRFRFCSFPKVHERKFTELLQLNIKIAILL